MRSRRITTAAAVALTVGLFAAGCSATPATDSAGTSASPGSVEATATGAAAVIKQAAERTEAEQTAKMRGDVTITGSGTDTTMKLDGAVDFASGNLTGTLTADILGQNTSMQFLSVDGKSYVQLPMLGDKWIESPADAGLTSTDPLNQLDSLKDVADLKEVGTEDVEGVSTTHYTGTIDLTKALESAGLSGEQLKEAEKSLSKVDDGAKLDVWVDDEGRIVKVSQDLSLNVGKNKASMNSTLLFTDFGTEVEVTAPNPDDVMSAGSLANMSQPESSQG